LVVVTWVFAEDRGHSQRAEPWRVSLRKELKDLSETADSALANLDLRAEIPNDVISENANPIVIDVNSYSDFGPGKHASLIVVPLQNPASEHPFSELMSISSDVQVLKVPEYMLGTLRAHSTRLTDQKYLNVDARTSTAPVGITVRFRQDGQWRHFTGIAPYNLVEVAGGLKAEEVRQHYTELSLVNTIMGIIGGVDTSSFVYEMYQRRYMGSVAGGRYHDLFVFYHKLERHKKGLAAKVLKRELARDKYNSRSGGFDFWDEFSDEKPKTREAK